MTVETVVDAAQLKVKGAALQEIAKQVRLGKDMQLDAAGVCAAGGAWVGCRDPRRAGSRRHRVL